MVMTKLFSRKKGIVESTGRNTPRLRQMLGVRNICWECRRSIPFFRQFSDVYFLALPADGFRKIHI